MEPMSLSSINVTTGTSWRSSVPAARGRVAAAAAQALRAAPRGARPERRFRQRQVLRRPL